MREKNNQVVTIQILQSQVTTSATEGGLHNQYNIRIAKKAKLNVTNLMKKRFKDSNGANATEVESLFSDEKFLSSLKSFLRHLETSKETN